MLPTIHEYIPGSYNEFCICTAHKDYLGHAMWLQMFSEEIKMDQNLCEQCGKIKHVDGTEASYCHELLKAKDAMNSAFITKDSGKRQEFSTGMQRDVQDDKPRYDLLDMSMLKRWAELMARGAKKYGENNWKKAATEEELARFKASALRHMFQYLEGDTSEDHGAAVFFNVAGAEMVKDKLGKLPVTEFVGSTVEYDSKTGQSISDRERFAGVQTFNSQDPRLK